MRSHFCKKTNPIFLIVLLFSIAINSFCQTTFTTLTTSGSFVVPCGVTSMTVQCWGGGGAGGGATFNPAAGGGGAGGAFSSSVIPVTGGASIPYSIGAGGIAGAAIAGPVGGTTTFSTIIAVGGPGGAITGANNTSGAGGIASSAGSAGSIIFAGGSGGTGASGTTAGGGGEAGYTGGVGVNGGNNTAGTSGNPGGDGGAASTGGAAGSPGIAPGGGGGGGRTTSNTDRAGGNGGTGQVVVIYSTPPTANAGPDQTPIVCTTTATLSGNIIAGYTGSWTCLSNCTGVTINASTSANSTVSGLSNGTATAFQWVLTETSTGCSLASDNVTITPAVGTCPPANDDPSGAIPISTGATCSYTTFTNANATPSSCGTIPAPGCASYSGGDVWFSVTVPASGSMSFDSQTGVILDGGMAIYSGTPCGVLTLIGCDDDSSPNGAMPMLTVVGQTPGATLYVRFWEYGNDNNGTFGLCATAIVAPANDDCGGAISLTVNSGTTCTTSAGGTLLGATTSTQTNSCAGGTADDDVWYKFTATASTHSVSITNIAGSVTDMYHSVYGGTCGSIGSPLVCSDPNSSVISGLTIGSVYYIRIFSNTATAGQNTTFSVCVTTPPPPPTNDNCSGSTAFPVIPTDGTCSTLNNQTTANATASGVSPSGACTSNSGSPTNDVWFSFTATSTTQTLTATWVSGETDVYWQVFSGACGASMNALVCTDVNAGGTIFGLTIGQTYYIRLYAYFAGTTVQNICLTGVPPPPPPANDNCTGATTLTVNSGSTCTTSSGGTLLGATTSSNSNTCFGTADDDVWYQFTATATSHSVSITNVAGSVTDMYHSVYAGTCGSIGLPLTCSDPNTSLITGLTIGNIYYVRVYSYTSTGGQNTTFSVCVLTPPPPPANDECAGAVNVTVNGGTTCTSQANGTVLGATASSYSNACGGTADDDVWYKFTATSTTHSISITNIAGSVTDMYHSLYAGTCGAIGAPLICSDPESSAISGLTIGSVYYIRVFSYTSTSGQTTTFSVCVTTPAAGPTNDNCTGATVVTVNSGTTCTTQAGGTLVNAYASTVPNDCSGTADDDVWYKFVATATTHSISINNIASTPTDLYHSVYIGTCGTLGSALVCSDPNSSVITGLTIGTTYFVRIFSYTSGTGSTTTFSLCISTPTMPPAPANDECAGAYPVTVNSGTTCTSLTGGTLLGATASTPTNSCGGTIDDDDVWYSFVASAAYHQITLSNIAGSTTDLYHSVFAGTCGAIGSALTCSDPNSSAVNGLTIGATYYIRIYSFGSTWGATTTFSVCITTPPPPPVNTSCSGMTPICSGSAINFTAESNGATAAPGPNYGCLYTKPNPTWFFMEILTSGTMAVDITAASDIDFALWGPYANLAAAKADCSSYPTPIDCSYSSSAIEQANIASAVVGEVYALLVTNYANTVQNITLNQAAGANATTNCAIILPIELLYFNAIPNENSVNINWETASELNNDYFEIERSIDGVKWEVLTRKTGMGTINTKTSYNSVDGKPFPGMSYYRLKQVDFNQSFIYSNSVSVDLSNGKEQITNVHPNPTNDNIEFDVVSKIKNQISVELIDNTGNVVNTQQNIIDEGKNSIKLNLEKFDSGIYLLKVSFENTGKSVIQKVIKR